MHIRLCRGQIQQFPRIAQSARESIETADDLLELGAFFSQFLRTVRIAPNAGLLELALYFLQPLVLVIVIKDTSSKSRCALRDL
jgi:spore maturation protein SpmA